MRIKHKAAIVGLIGMIPNLLLASTITDVTYNEDLLMSPRFSLTDYQLGTNVQDVLNNTNLIMSPRFSLTEYGLVVSMQDVLNNTNLIMSPRFSIDTYNVGGNILDITNNPSIIMSPSFSLVDSYNINFNLNGTDIITDSMFTEKCILKINSAFSSDILTNISSVSYRVVNNDGSYLTPEKSLTVNSGIVSSNIDLSLTEYEKTYLVETYVKLKDDRVIINKSPRLYKVQSNSLGGILNPMYNTVAKGSIDVKFFIHNTNKFSKFDLVIKDEDTGKLYSNTGFNKETYLVETKNNIGYYNVNIPIDDNVIKRFSIILKVY